MLFPFSRWPVCFLFWDDLPFPRICQLSSLQSLINDDVLTTCCLSAKKGLLRINFCKQDRETRNTQFRQTGEKQQAIQPNKGQKRENAEKNTAAIFRNNRRPFGNYFDGFAPENSLPNFPPFSLPIVRNRYRIRSDNM